MRRLRKDLFAVLALFLAEQRGPLLVGAALAVATVLAGIALLGLSGWFITATAIAGLSAATALAFDVFAPSAGIRFLTLARTAARYGERLKTHDATLAVLAALRERLFRGWAQPGAARALLLRPARLLFRLTADIDALDSLYLRVLVPAATALGAALAAGLVLGLIAPWLGLAATGVLIAGGLGVPLLGGRRALLPARRRAHAIEALRSRTIDLVAGQTDLAMTGGLSRQRDAIAAADLRLAVVEDRLNRIDAGVTAGLGAVSAILLAGTLAAVALLAEAGTIGAPVAALGVLVVFAAIEPFAGLRRGALELGRTLLALRRLAPRLAARPAPWAPSAPAGGAAVHCEAAGLRHDGASRDALAGISFTIRPGERVAVLGPSGAGKSTLLALLAGEIAPGAGLVECRPATLLTQRTELFSDTLRDNLRLAAPEADDERLLAALDAAGLGRVVADLPQGLDTLLGEGGLGLSGGQARRLALARLFLRDPAVPLLDEPTEGLDGATARDVLARLGAWAQGRTTITATHVRREAETADRLLVMGGGRLRADLRRGEPDFERTLSDLRPD